MYEAVDGNGSLFTGGNGINGEFGAGDHISTGEDICLGSLVGERVGLEGLVGVELSAGAFEQSTPFNGLADGNQDEIGFDDLDGIFVIAGVEVAVGIKDGEAFLELHTGHVAVLGEDSFGTPAIVDHDAFFFSFAHFFVQSGHLFAAFQAVQVEGFCTHTNCAAGHINGHVAAANDDAFPLEGNFLAQVDASHKVHAAEYIRGIFAGNVQLAAGLGADGDVEGLVTLLAQIVHTHIFAHFHTAFDLNAHLFEDLDLGVDHVLFKPESGDAQSEHATGDLFFFKHGHVVTVNGQVVGTGKPGRPGADDGDLVAVVVAFLGHVAMFSVHVLLSNKLLDLIHSHGVINVCTCAFRFAQARADASAHSREGILVLDQLKSITVTSQRGQFNVPLHANVGRAVGLAGAGTGIHHVLAVVAVIGVPIFGTPFIIARGFAFGLHDLGLAADLLAQLQGIYMAAFHAFAAGNTFFCVNAGDVVGAYHIGINEHFSSAQREAGAAAAVADGVGLAGAIGIGDLVDQPVLFGALDDFVGFLAGDLTATACADVELGGMAHLDAHIFFQMTAAFAHAFAHGTAGAIGD
ncbi:hypothetical protein SDC9_110145 [bioreactor metagenome]|uniref:NAD-specific glutamate dehydrogenase n=1 Tax=bioreactor metagenome TaxID=1076179 RepID=A0A645BCT8_9ZZZZ